MINIEQIEQEILNLEKHDTTYATVERLAWLYIVKDHLKPTNVSNKERTGSFASESRFMKACENVPINSLLEILSEHMEAVEMIYPKEYDALIGKIEALSLP